MRENHLTHDGVDNVRRSILLAKAGARGLCAGAADQVHAEGLASGGAQNFNQKPSILLNALLTGSVASLDCLTQDTSADWTCPRKTRCHAAEHHSARSKLMRAYASSTSSKDGAHLREATAEQIHAWKPGRHFARMST